ncbi:GntR family transcriptional regulator [Bradyrhizobium sp. SYSU BS000235]|jgi:DNA-binding GntR family transcriptional regulator|uniref:GntR family transcriptional regulator n=1 Tax=Bradyrhizobium sp. SYSU BS000235 TaxID=3411332 RepID=UPI003C7939AB
MAKAAQINSIASVSETLYGRLRDGILSGDFPPGLVLRQEELSRRFGASRVPLREAMTRLEVEGLVVLRPRRGYAVLSLEPAEIREIFELRAVVEEHLAGIAAKTRTEKDVAAVQQSLSRMERIAAKTPNQTDKWMDENSEFHARLLGAAHRRHAGRFAGMLRDQVEPYIRVEIGLTKEVMQAEDEHRRMFDALRAGDAPRLRKLCRQHCENTASRLIKAL